MKRLLSAVAVMFVCLILVPSLLSAQPGSVRVTAERTSVRDRAATDGAVVATVARGEQLQVLEVSGSWFKVRTPAGREGYVYNLFVERVGGAAPAAPAAAPTPAPAPAPAATTPRESQTQTQAPPRRSQPALAGNGSDPLGNRRFGVGLANIGPSVRYWMDSKKGFQVDGYFRSSYGYSVAAISPSFIAHFKEPKMSESLMFAPYWGGGITYYHFDNGYNDYYCGRFDSCSSSNISFGGFLGSEMVINKVPKLALSGQAGFYSGIYGYGGFGIGFGAHYYFGAK